MGGAKLGRQERLGVADYSRDFKLCGAWAYWPGRYHEGPSLGIPTAGVSSEPGSSHDE